MDDAVILEWSFTPGNYFEHEISDTRSGYEIVIRDGSVEARIDPAIYDDEHKMREDLHALLNSRFLAAQVLSHKPYELSQSTVCRLRSDGSKAFYVFPASCVIAVTAGSPDLIVKDADGNVVIDSRRDRLERGRTFAERVSEHAATDAFLRSLLASYSAAVNDPENELVHLYEIRDALTTYFGKEAATCNTLNLSATDWSRFGRLANAEPIRQGRHRGKNPDALRDATNEELEDVRGIARSFIEAYLTYLDTASYLPS